MEALEEDCPTTRNRMLLGVGVCLSAQFLAAGASYWGMKAPLKAKQTRLETRLEKFVNADKQNRLTQRLVKFVNADIAPPPKMSLEMAIDLEGGASWLMTKAQFNQFVKGKPTVGRPDGQFVTSARQMNRVMSESGGDSQKLGELLGVPEWTTNTELVRVDVVNPTRYNPLNCRRLKYGLLQSSDVVQTDASN